RQLAGSGSGDLLRQRWSRQALRRTLEPSLSLARRSRPPELRASGLERRSLMAIAPPRAVWGYIRFFLTGKTWRPEQLYMAQMGVISSSMAAVTSHSS